MTVDGKSQDMLTFKGKELEWEHGEQRPVGAQRAESLWEHGEKRTCGEHGEF